MSEQEAQHPMAGHVLGQIGIHATEAGDPCGSGIHLHLSPQVMTSDGHVDFGVLGVFLDLASSQPGFNRGFVHADISVHRVDRPRGEKLLTTVRMPREGKRSAVVEVDVHDELGTRVAYSVQQIRFATPPMPEDPKRFAAIRAMFQKQFDGTCRLRNPLHEMLEISRDGEAWRMPLTSASRNGFGGLHGGVTFAIVGDAAAGAAGPGAKATSALIRYLAKGGAGPFRAVPTVMPQADGDAIVRVELYDEGADDLLISLGEVHVVTADG